MKSGVQLGLVLIAFGVVCMAAAGALWPDPVRTHDTRTSVNQNVSVLEDSPVRYRVVAYENLSDRGQELYRGALESGGTVRTDVGNGAPEWSYDEVTVLVIDRSNASSLPPADETAPRSGGEDARYDAMRIGTEQSTLRSESARLVRVLGGLGIVAIVPGAFALITSRDGLVDW